MKRNLQIILAAIFFALSSSAAIAQVASNPPYVLEQSVITGGGTGADAVNNAFSVTGTIGQPLAGTRSTNSPFAVSSGFWNVLLLNPTAASAC